jgi:hypothetical protein
MRGYLDAADRDVVTMGEMMMRCTLGSTRDMRPMRYRQSSIADPVSDGHDDR